MTSQEDLEKVPRGTPHSTSGVPAALDGGPDVAATPAMPAGGKSVAERVFMVLLAFDPRHRVMTQSEIARRTGLPVATVHRLLHKLEGMGAVERDAQGHFTVGPLMWRLGILAPTHDVIGMGVRPLLMSLSARTSSDVRVLSYFDEAAMCVDEILAVSLSADRGLGEMHSLHGSAGGIAVAAQLPPESRQRLRLTRRVLDELEQRVALARDRHHVMLDGGGRTELAVVLNVGDRPPMSLSIQYWSEPGGKTAHRLAALHEAGRAVAAILNEGRRP